MLAVSRDYVHTASTINSISRFFAADPACTPSISGFDTKGAACTQGSVLVVLPVLAVLGPQYCSYS